MEGEWRIFSPFSATTNKKPLSNWSTGAAQQTEEQWKTSLCSDLRCDCMNQRRIFTKSAKFMQKLLSVIEQLKKHSCKKWESQYFTANSSIFSSFILISDCRKVQIHNFVAFKRVIIVMARRMNWNVWMISKLPFKNYSQVFKYFQILEQPPEVKCFQRTTSCFPIQPLFRSSFVPPVTVDLDSPCRPSWLK